jgi:protein TonB
MKIIIVTFFVCLFISACSSGVSSSTEIKNIKLSPEDSLIVSDELRKTYSESDTFLSAEKIPEPIGGMEKIAEKLYYTKEARANNIEGRVLVQFLVKKDGSVENIRVIKGLGFGLDEIAISAIKTTEFKPGEVKGEPVNIETTLPLTFKLK